MDDLETYKLIEHWDLTIKQEMMGGTLQSDCCQATVKWFTDSDFEGEITQPRGGIKYKIWSGFARYGLFKGSISFEAIADNGAVRYFYGNIVDEWSIFGHWTSKDEKEHDDVNARWSAFRQRKQMETDLILEVDDDGTISLVNCYKPKIRADFYDIGDYDTCAPKRLVEAAKKHPPLQWLIADRYTDYRENPTYPARLKSMPKNSDKGWIDWVVGADDQTFSTLIKDVNKWLSEEPNWNWEEDYFVVSGDSERVAFELLKDEPDELLDALGVVIIEGDRPGSNYCGAKLCRPIEESNVIAELKGLGYRFLRKDEAT